MKLFFVAGFLIGIICAEFAFIELLCQSHRRVWLPLGAVGTALVATCALALRG